MTGGGNICFLKASGSSCFWGEKWVAVVSQLGMYMVCIPGDLGSISFVAGPRSWFSFCIGLTTPANIRSRWLNNVGLSLGMGDTAEPIGIMLTISLEIGTLIPVLSSAALSFDTCAPHVCAFGLSSIVSVTFVS